jgi:hypothetical protein
LAGSSLNRKVILRKTRLRRSDGSRSDLNCPIFKRKDISGDEAESHVVDHKYPELRVITERTMLTAANLSRFTQDGSTNHICIKPPCG